MEIQYNLPYNIMGFSNTLTNRAVILILMCPNELFKDFLLKSDTVA